MPMNWPISRIVACAHVQQSVSDYLQVKYEFGKPFSSVLEQVELERQASSGIDLEIRSELYCV